MYGYITDVDICNLALNYLGKGSIESLDERSELARTCKLHYDRYRRMALTATTWGFALKTQALKNLDIEIPGYKAIYEYPDTALELVRVYERKMLKGRWITATPSTSSKALTVVGSFVRMRI